MIILAQLIQKTKNYFRAMWDREPGWLEKSFYGLLLIPIIILFVALGMGFTDMVVRDWWNGDGLKCPQEYSDVEEGQAAFDTFTSNFYDKNPSASMRDFAKARLSFYKKHNCAEELKKYTAAAPDDIEKQIDSMVENATQVMDAAAEDDFNLISFDGYMAQSEKYRNNTTIGIVSRKSESSADEASGVVIAARQNDPGYSAMDWLKSEYSGYDFTNGYKEGKVAGVVAYFLRWENPQYIDGVLFLTPDGRQRITISILGDAADPLLRDHLQKVLDGFSFK